MNYGLHLIKAPSGRFVFVGNVPAVLAYVMPDGSTPTDDFVRDQLMLPASYRTIKTRAFEHACDALVVAHSEGFDVTKPE